MSVSWEGYSRVFARIQKLINQLLYSLREVGRHIIVLALRLGLMSITNCDQFELGDVAKLVDDRLSISLYFRQRVPLVSFGCVLRQVLG